MHHMVIQIDDINAPIKTTEISYGNKITRKQFYIAFIGQIPEPIKWNRFKKQMILFKKGRKKRHWTAA